MYDRQRRRYVPKGGHLVDFEKRLTPKLKRILSKEQQGINTWTECQFGETKDKTDQICLKQTNGYSDDSSQCMAMVVWSGEDVANQGEGHGKSSKVGMVHASNEYAHLPEKTSITKKTTSWKPPGCLKTSLWKRPAHHKKGSLPKTMQEKVSLSHPVRCESCSEMESNREHIQCLKTDLEEKQRQLHLRTIHVESLASKCSRERKAFESYKEKELEYIQRTKESMKVKKKRDMLAFASEARGSSQHTEIARLRIQIEEYDASLKEHKMKMKTEAQKYKVDIDRYRDHQKLLEEEIATLRNALANVSTKETDDSILKRDSFLQSPSTPQNVVKSSIALSKKEAVKVIHHDNHTVERNWPNGTVQFLYENGDIRQSYEPSGIVEYFYSGVECWNASYPDGDHIYYFKDGRRECHGSDGTIQILLGDHQMAYSTTKESSDMMSIPVTSINLKILQSCPTML